ncbi:hypothetical protein ACFSCZ_11170 [Siminovitchia sediminis]|uniref:Uncharacterized protein n=1 Tax=Siminovitchia sediminis TaxID=1274353 RepID=A0ABW4KKH4_9BACI
MFLDSYINQKIQIKFKHLPEAMTGPVTGIYYPDKWCVAKLIYTESMGIWIENPCYERTKVLDDDGTAVPKADQFSQRCPTHLLIKWEYIASIVTFPAEELTGAGEEAKMIGFQT